MKVYQLITLAYQPDLDMESLLEDARTPNPVFLTLERAKTFAQEENNALPEDYLEDEEELEWSYLELQWAHDEEKGLWYAQNDDFAVSFTIHCTNTVEE